MTMKFKNGQKVIVELIAGDLFEGEFICSSETKITLNNCINLHTNIPMHSLYYFYINEIKNAKALQNDESTTDSCNMNKEETSDMFVTSAITVAKYNELNLLVNNYLYLPVKDCRYFEAINSLSNAETIGVSIMSSDYGRLSPISILVVSTWNQIYLFDILLYNCKQLPKEFKYIFECEDIVKIVHDSRELVDCLHHYYKVSVNNIFDTCVAADIVSGERLSLPDCLTKYFKMPIVFLNEALDPSLKPKWKIRPLGDYLCKMAARNVLYLFFLKTFLQKQLLKEFHQKVLTYSQGTLDQSPFEAFASLAIK